ncbi:MAG TPA: Xaa-Pro peptidase family protein [Pyrinomonadaceae bacterium]|jgi:Xaa-Pro aminopeptidase|nr:Xaa-Pro peptidase family protein [Pyrinomonadaceae bacterium]
MKKIFLGISLLALIFAAQVSAQTTASAASAEEKFDLTAVQKALKDGGFDGWLFYDFRGSDPLAARILKLRVRTASSRRWFYYIPASGEPVKIVHAIEQARLDELPGKKLVYAPWDVLQKDIKDTLLAGAHGKKPRVAMEYSPDGNIPYIARVDAGTIELIRGFGVDVVPSGDLIQRFEAVWNDNQFAMHKEANEKVHKVIQEAFAEIKRRINANIPVNEYDIAEFISRRLDEEGVQGGGNVSVSVNTANPHYDPSKDKSAEIKKGDLVLFDIVGKLKKPKATQADLTWIGYVGDTVPEEYVKIWNIVHDARDAAFNFVKSAMRDKKPITGAQVDDAARAVIKKAGYGEYFTHRTGHNIGEEVHGSGTHMDNFETKDTRSVLPRTCFSIEPGIYLTGKFGVRSEIDVFTTENDAISATPMQTEIIAILK